MTVKEELKSYIEQIPKIFSETGIDVAISKSHTQYIEYSLKSEKSPLKSIIDGDPLSLSVLLENFACDLYINQSLLEAEKLFEDAFICRRDYMSVNGAYDEELLFYLSVAALGAKRVSELRLTLDEHDISFESSEKEWPILVQTNIIKAFLLLCRKKNGWKDIENAVTLIKTLHELQKEFEKKYLSKMSDMAVTFKITGVGRLVALYNLAKVIEIVGSYLITANPANPILKIKKHYDNAVEALERSGDYSLEHFSDMLFVGCDALINNSIWYNTQTLGEKATKLVQELADAGREKPFIELWPSQQEAMRSSLFDPAKHAVVLQMPTSAGKTLLAEFSIVQSLALNPDNTVVYVVPTRALVNQTTLQLRRDLGPLGFITEAAVPVFELDPTENELLRKKCHILVSTPEKIELLMRAKHPIVNTISLIVVDEVHNISDANRGSTLELFLGTVLREKSGVRFLVMSPFIPNGDEIGSWLGKDRNAQIKVNWKPSERITAAASYVGKKANKYIQLKTLLSAHNSDVKE
ncbi:MAG: DEAD/DEAH box helicase, partial [Dehalococcoidales bacterium]